MKRSQLSLILLGSALVILLAASGTVAQGKVSLQGSRAFTALGSAFTYQGRFTEAGKPANGFFDFEFKLYNALSGGSQVGNTRAFDNLQVVDGLITATLDFGPGAFNGEPRWLDIGVRPGASVGAYTPLTPRQALTPAPYALYAGSAPWEGLGGVPAGFADGVDNDTPSTVGAGLKLDNNQISLDTAFTDTLYWSATGNAEIPASNFLGTTDSMSMTLGVNNTPILQLVPNEGLPEGVPPGPTVPLPGVPAGYFSNNRGGRDFGSGQRSIVQVGERYRDNSIFAWGRVNGNGGIYSDFGVNYVSHPAPGRYRIHTSDYAGDGASLIPVAIAELENPPADLASMRVVYINQIGDGPSELFEVYITDGNGVSVDNDFVFMVTGR